VPEPARRGGLRGGKQDGGARGDSALHRAAEDRQDQAGWKIRLPKPPPDVDFKGAKVTWKLETNVGNIAIDLLPEVAPKHVTSTVYLTQLGFYDDVPFHRVIPEFMAQGGDPTGRGTGGPGYQYGGEFDPKVKHDQGGLLSMANAGPNTDGSQFFLTFVATPWLDGKHTIFGRITQGMDTLKKLEEKGTRAVSRRRRSRS
jgi:peptidylprolyl isomerase